MSTILTKVQASSLLGLDEKIFENYFKNAKEFLPIPRVNDRGRFTFNQEDLEKWQEGYKWRTVELTIDDYKQCLDFALAMHFRGYVLSDWGTARQREFGQKITNWVKGQLAEVAVKKFLKDKFNVDIQLDFQIHNAIVPQDIIGIKDGGVYRQPKVGIGIKSSKPKSAFLILSENEITIPERRSDYYILCRPDIPDDHLLRLAKGRVEEIVWGQYYFSTYQEKIPDFENMFCEVCGWCEINELEKVSEIPGQKFENGYRYVKESGLLHKNPEDWEKLIAQL